MLGMFNLGILFLRNFNIHNYIFTKSLYSEGSSLFDLLIKGSEILSPERKAIVGCKKFRQKNYT